MATAVADRPSVPKEAPTFTEKHLPQIAFAVATLALLLLAPLSLILGTGIGLTVSKKCLPLKTEQNSGDKIITPYHAVFAIVGATTAFLSFIPVVGSIGGLFLKAAPLATSFSIGHAAHNWLSSYNMSNNMPKKGSQ